MTGILEAIMIDLARFVWHVPPRSLSHLRPVDRTVIPGFVSTGFWGQPHHYGFITSLMIATFGPATPGTNVRPIAQASHRKYSAPLATPGLRTETIVAGYPQKSKVCRRETTLMILLCHIRDEGVLVRKCVLGQTSSFLLHFLRGGELPHGDWSHWRSYFSMKIGIGSLTRGFSCLSGVVSLFS